MTPLQLIREAPCRGELRLGKPSRAAIVGGTVMRGSIKVMAMTAVLVCVLGLFFGPRTMHGFPESKGDIAKATVKKYAFEAYPSWAAVHPDESCPEKLEDLNEYMNNKDTKDPWGGTYKMLCGANLPAGAKGLAVWSPGEDHRFGTGDDIKSWD